MPRSILLCHTAQIRLVEQEDKTGSEREHEANGKDILLATAMAATVLER